jgi:hypothetical protein
LNRWRSYLVAVLVMLACVPAMRAQAAKNVNGIATLFIVGDSTAHVNGNTKYGRKKRVGWGSEFPVYFNPAKMRVVNAAAAGRSS